MKLPASSVKAFLLTFVLTVTLCEGRWGNVKHMEVSVSDEQAPGGTGYARNCDTVPFNFSWTPKELSPSGSVDVHVTYKLPYDLDTGFVNISVAFHGEAEPFIGYTNQFTCDTIKKYLPCPLPKGFFINMTKTISNLHDLTSYPGHYDLHLEVKNKDGKEMICLDLDILIREL